MAQNQPRIQYSNLDLPFGFIGFDMDFDTLYKHYFDQLLYITMRLIVFDGLPASIDETFLKYTLLLSGKSVFFRLDEDIIDSMQDESRPLKAGDLVALNGNKSDVPTLYYMQRKILVTNPCFKKTYDLLPGKDCVVVYCTETDKYKVFGYGGLFALIARTATILADNDISINCAQKNTRLVNVIGADDQQTARSAQMAVDAMYNGKPYVIAQKSLVSDLTGIPMTQKTSTSDIVQLIEMRQYIYAHFYEVLGLQTHDNMKKERLITEEINDNEEISALNVDDILVSIQDGIDSVNKMFGTNITVSLNPIIQRAHVEDAAEDQTEDAAEDQTEDAAEDQTEDAAEDQTEDAAEDQTEDAAEDQTEDAAEDQTEDAAEDQTEDAAEDQTEDAAEDQTEDAAEDQTEDAAEDQTEDAAEDQTEDASEDQTEDAAEDQTEDAAEDQTEDAAEDQTEDAAEDQTEDAAEELPGQMSFDITVNAQDDTQVSIVIGEEVQTDDVPGDNAAMARNGADAGG